ncbi:MAG: hypothetical protein WCS69_06395 [Ignavibacteriaceae bacterium]
MDKSTVHYWAISQFGEDTDEYERLGGIRKSNRKKPVRKPKG